MWVSYRVFMLYVHYVVCKHVSQRSLTSSLVQTSSELHNHSIQGRMLLTRASVHQPTVGMTDLSVVLFTASGQLMLSEVMLYNLLMKSRLFSFTFPHRMIQKQNKWQNLDRTSTRFCLRLHGYVTDKLYLLLLPLHQ